MLKKGVFSALLLAICLLFPGCQAIQSIDELYQLPQLPTEYTHLQTQIDALLQGGAQYSAPVSGNYLQALQMIDLDGDGNQEALAFLCNETQEKPLEIHIFDNNGEDFEHTDTIYGNGTQIYSVAYQDLNQDGQLELIIGWRISAEVQALSVYQLEDAGPRELMTTNYVRYTIADLNKDGILGVIVLRTDSEGQGDGLAEVYQWKDETLSIAASASLSMTMGELSQQGRVTQGVLQDGRTAIFVTGVSAEGLSMLDILAWEDEMLKNIVLSPTTGITAAISPFLSLYPSDINANGVTDAPLASPLPSLFEDLDTSLPTEYQINWTQFNGDGQGSVTMSTYHNADQGWYLVLPSQWLNQFTVERTTIDAEESAVTFYRMTDDDSLRVAEAYLRISYLTGDNREYNAVWGNRFVLSRQTSAIITAEFYEANTNWDTPLTEDQLRNAFYTITAEWKPGES